MRKFKVAFAATMLMIMALTAGVMAATPTGNVRSSDYNNNVIGDRAIFCAHGYKGSSTSVSATSSSYTTMYNLSDSAHSMSAYVAEYVYDSGWKTSKSNRYVLEPGYAVSSGTITRYYNSRIRYYYHVGSVYTASGSSTIVERHDYKANQYY